MKRFIESFAIVTILASSIAFTPIIIACSFALGYLSTDGDYRYYVFAGFFSIGYICTIILYVKQFFAAKRERDEEAEK